MGVCTSTYEPSEPWTPSDPRYPTYRPRADYKPNLPPVPMPFSWGPNGALILLLVLEMPLILIAMAIWLN